MTGKLSIVATPIGNSEDITLRALRILKEADFIVCEDTKTTKKLLSIHEIQTRLESFHTHSDSKKLEYLLSLLEEGKHLAYVSDAGTPGISDPGPYFVRVVQERFPEVDIEIIPGPDSVSAALSGAGIIFKEYLFWGFVPQKKGRKTFLEHIEESDFVSVCFESSHRIKKFLTELSNVLDSNREVAVVKEITKIHETVIRGTVNSILETFSQDTKLEKGEFVVIIDAKK
jgi:16S rRNA (cytidine1402-2'-O)-methyltransferase